MSRSLWEASLEGIRTNLIPGVILWAIGLAVVFIYYRVPASHGLFEQVSDLKARYGFGFSAFSTAFFGGFIPFLYLWWVGKIPAGKWLPWALFFVLFWALRGMEVDLLYRLQAKWFGDSVDWQTIATKVVVDQFVYCPFWSAPVTAIFYGWKRVGFSWSAYRKGLTLSQWAFQISSLLLSTWIVWIPGTAIIYSLPLLLQIPLFNLVLCFFVLLISVLAPKQKGEEEG
ncbi:MAG: hypothetical protein AAF733_09280 [Verrucomicrobiota bacterium]